jgi:hypothetical protein
LLEGASKGLVFLTTKEDGFLFWVVALRNEKAPACA